MKLPILASVPHAGLTIPPEAAAYCCLTPEEIVQDGDEGAAEIYDLSDTVATLVTTDIARAIVDLNRATDDRRPDGVVKTHTCWDVPVYRTFPPEDVITDLLTRYYVPYHARLTMSFTADIRLAVDCHTMAAVGPPIGPDPGKPRPWVCLGDRNGQTLPAGWMGLLEECFGASFDGHVAVNRPFNGGYITRRHGRDAPWLQLELSREAFLSNAEKRDRVVDALTRFCDRL